MSDPSGYDVVLSGDEEHLYPSGDDAHDPASGCPCEPLRGEDTRTGDTVWIHRTQVPPL